VPYLWQVLAKSAPRDAVYSFGIALGVLLAIGAWVGVTRWLWPEKAKE
jgi:hypothetical protein